ncbi:ABC transporter substrate-binding protein [Hydrogenophaga sp. YM1]|nr:MULTISPECIES: ABC transporter substrate-binding protein [unclassified Hydrogenophaga]MBN9370514.1 ABC transporter substrate-binding protein [Hydrogenophaga sp.]OJV69988.1 MAG: ABC transporter substrate-binding protein [Hydrogenophaga sp. 70-12]QRR35405.1 ABC transporter substrate-binding protein [Hydrogenophaga sp. YM1]
MAPTRVPPRRRALLRATAALVAGTALPAFAAAPPRAPRLVTVGGGITEVVYALGAQDLLVGTDTTSLYPAAALATPKVGYLRQLSAEGLLALRPDTVIAPGDAGPPVVLDQLRSAGVTVDLIESSHDWGEVRRKVQAVGRAASKARAAQDLLVALDAQWDQALRRVRAHAGPAPRVLFVLAHGGSPMVAGEATAAHALIGFAGARNALSGFKGYRPMTAEAMAAAAPHAILTTTQGLDAIGGEAAFWRRPELPLTPAWRRRDSGRALVHLDALELLGFGPRLPRVVGELHQRLVAA